MPRWPLLPFCIGWRFSESIRCFLFALVGAFLSPIFLLHCNRFSESPCFAFGFGLAGGKIVNP